MVPVYKVPCYSPLKGYKDPATGGLTFDRDGTFEKLEVACGRCLGCRLDYSSMWAMRIVHEASLHEYRRGNCFVTLTYRDARECSWDQKLANLHVPDDWSLNPRHLQDFLKRLRAHFEYYDPDGGKIRFFAVGEYGKKCKHGIDLDLVDCPLCFVGRPHFHVCLFNCAFDDLQSYSSDGNVLRHTSKTLEKLWRYGFVDVGEVNYESAQYGARYILKKIHGKQAHDHYMAYTMDGEVTYLEPEYCVMSRGGKAGKGENCGIGAKWYEKFKTDVFPSDEVPIPGHGIVQTVPRYYEEIFKKENPGAHKELKKKRRKFKEDNKEEFSPERLEAKYKCKKAKLELRKSRIL